MNPIHEPTTHRSNFWKAEETTCPIFDLSGEVVGEAKVIFHVCKNECVEIADISFDGAEQIDAVHAIQEKVGVRETLIFI